MWRRQSYRLGDMDFSANLKGGIAGDWPIRYADRAPWYDYVERYIGVAETRTGCLNFLMANSFRRWI